MGTRPKVLTCTCYRISHFLLMQLSSKELLRLAQCSIDVKLEKERRGDSTNLCTAHYKSMLEKITLPMPTLFFDLMTFTCRCILFNE